MPSVRGLKRPASVVRSHFWPPPPLHTSAHPNPGADSPTSCVTCPDCEVVTNDGTAEASLFRAALYLQFNMAGCLPERYYSDRNLSRRETCCDRHISSYASRYFTLCFRYFSLCFRLQTLESFSSPNIERVVLDELAAKPHIIIHQLGEDGLGLLLSLGHQSFVRTHER